MSLQSLLNAISTYVNKIKARFVLWLADGQLSSSPADPRWPATFKPK